MLVGIYGASGFGREVLPVVRSCVSAGDQIVFIDDSCAEMVVNQAKVVDWAGFLSLESSAKSVCVAIADASLREKLTAKCLLHGVSLFEAIAPNSVIMDEVAMGEGAIICPFVVLTSNIQIGKSFHANIYSYVAHDCVVGDFVTLAPSVKCNGNVVLENFSYIGTGAIIKQGMPGKPIVIGEGAIVGMGSVVTKSVAPRTVVVGNPARSIKIK